MADRPLEGEMRKTILTILAIFLLLIPVVVVAHEHGDREGFLSLAQREQDLGEVSDFFRNLAVIYSQELQRGATTTNLKFQYGLPVNGNLIDPQQEQARMIAQTALRSVVQQKMQEVEWLHTMKTYGERMTSAQLRVTEDDVQVSGPSLREHPPVDGIGSQMKRPVLSIRSGMGLTDNSHLAPMIQADLAHLNSKVVFDPLAGGDWRFSLGRSINSHSAVEMVYLFNSTDHQNLLATFRFNF